jgi:hypothetical protein
VHHSLGDDIDGIGMPRLSRQIGSTDEVFKRKRRDCFERGLILLFPQDLVVSA